MFYKAIFAAYSLCLAPAQALMAAQYLPLHKEMAVASMAYSDDFDYEAHAEDWLNLYMPDILNRVEAGELEPEEAREAAIEDMQRLEKAFENEEQARLVTFERMIQFQNYENDLNGFPLTPLFVERYFSASQTSAKVFPHGYQVLIANPDIASILPMTPEQAAAFKARRDRRPGAAKRRLYAEVQLKPVDFQNRRDIQAVITRLRLYGDSNHEEMLHEYRLEKDPAELIDNRLLSEGVTWGDSENHGFNYQYIRLLAVFPETHPKLKDCEKVGNIDEHDIIRCDFATRLGRVPLKHTRYYVGGRLARVDVHRVSKWGTDEREKFLHSLGATGIAPKTPPDEPITWNHEQASLTLYPGAVVAGTDETCLMVIEADPLTQLLQDQGLAGRAGCDPAWAPRPDGKMKSAKDA